MAAELIYTKSWAGRIFVLMIFVFVGVAVLFVFVNMRFYHKLEKLPVGFLLLLRIKTPKIQYSHIQIPPQIQLKPKTNLRPAHSWVYISSAATDYFYLHQSCQTDNTNPPIFTNTNTATPTNPMSHVLFE